MRDVGGRPPDICPLAGNRATLFNRHGNGSRQAGALRLIRCWEHHGPALFLAQANLAKQRQRDPPADRVQARRRERSASAARRFLRRRVGIWRRLLHLDGAA